jgi:hypothetical protein
MAEAVTEVAGLAASPALPAEAISAHPLSMSKRDHLLHTIFFISGFPIKILSSVQLLPHGWMCAKSR